MRIEDDDQRPDLRNDSIRQIKDYQARVDAEARERGRSETALERSGADDPGRIEEQRRDVTAGLQRAGELSEKQKSGSERHDDAVKAADAQQDRGESWQAFANDKQPDAIPPSVEEQRAEQQADRAREEEQRVSVRELLNRMRMQSGKIDA